MFKNEGDRANSGMRNHIISRADPHSAKRGKNSSKGSEAVPSSANSVKLIEFVDGNTN